MSGLLVTGDDITPPSTPRLTDDGGIELQHMAGGSNIIVDPYQQDRDDDADIDAGSSTDTKVQKTRGCSLSRTYCCAGEEEGCSWRRTACCVGGLLCLAGGVGAGYYYLIASQTADAIFTAVLGVGGGTSTCLFGTQQPLDGVAKGTKAATADYRRGLEEQRKQGERERLLLEQYQAARRADELRFQTRVAELSAIAKQATAKVDTLKAKLDKANGLVQLLTSTVETIEKSIDSYNQVQDFEDDAVGEALKNLEAAQDRRVEFGNTA